MSSIKDVSGEILFKKQKKDFLSYQRIVANSISKNKTLNLPEEKKIDADDSKNEPEINKFFLISIHSLSSHHC